MRKLGYASFEIATTMVEALAAAERQCLKLIDGTRTDVVLTLHSDKVIPVVFVTSTESVVRERLPNGFIFLSRSP